MKKTYLVLALSLIITSLLAQKNTRWQSVINETVYVASTVKAHEGIGARDRVLLDVDMPKGTIGYALRITVNCKNNNASSLISIIGDIPSPEIKAASVVSNWILNGDGNQCNVYMFTDRMSAQRFAQKQAGSSACKSFTQISSISNYENNCLNTICLGFQNNNMVKALQVRVELVALIKN